MNLMEMIIIVLVLVIIVAPNNKDLNKITVIIPTINVNKEFMEMIMKKILFMPLAAWSDAFCYNAKHVNGCNEFGAFPIEIVVIPETDDISFYNQQDFGSNNNSTNFVADEENGFENTETKEIKVNEKKDTQGTALVYIFETGANGLDDPFFLLWISNSARNNMNGKYSSPKLKCFKNFDEYFKRRSIYCNSI